MENTTIYPKTSSFTERFWEEGDLIKLNSAKTVQDLFLVADDIVTRMDPESTRIAQVCGPINNGGGGNIEANLAYLNDIIISLQKKGIAIFDQMPFESSMHRIVRELLSAHAHTDILKYFYEPLFRSGKIKVLYFVPGWEQSKGALKEHEMGQELSMEIIYL